MYLYFSSDSTNRALKKLKVRGEDPKIASQRLLLFMKAKEVLNKGLKILGIKPLNEM